MAIIYGTSSNDTLISTGPGDTLVGGAGDDLYIINDASDRITELPDSSHALTRISTDSLGGEANGASYFADYSADGTKIVFSSDATNLVAGDTNGVTDIYVKDLITGVVTRVTPTGAAQSNGASYAASFSGDGNTVVYSSEATNLVAGDTNGAYDIFATNLTTGVTTRVSTATGGTQADGPLFGTYGSDVSYDGTQVIFTSFSANLVAGDTNASADVFLKDLNTGVTTLVSSNGTLGSRDSGLGFASALAFTADSSKFVFSSDATNLVAGDTNGCGDIFEKDLVSGNLTLISTNVSGVAGNGYSYNPSISADGTKLVFESGSTNLVAGSAPFTNAVFVKDLTTGEVTLVTSQNTGYPKVTYFFNPVISADGTKVAFQTPETLTANDHNNGFDIYVMDIATGVKTLVTINDAGVQNADVIRGGSGFDVRFSPDGNALLFHNHTNNLVTGDTNDATDLFVKDITPASGIDTVQSSVSYALGANLENLILTGVADLTGTGNVLNNVLTGNSGKNTLSGASGNDTLIGGVGSDVYYVGTSDVIVENLGSGSDTAISSSSYTLSANVEKLILQGSLNLAGIGNDLGNTIIGNTGNNLLIGALGNDTLTGAAGYDSFLFNTALNATTNVDTIVDLTAQDRLQLSHLIFDQAGPVGTLSGSAFVAGAGLTSGQDSSDRIIYDSTNGKLYYDADGSGAGGSVLFAQLGTTTHPHLASVQIQVV